MCSLCKVSPPVQVRNIVLHINSMFLISIKFEPFFLCVSGSNLARELIGDLPEAIFGENIPLIGSSDYLRTVSIRILLSKLHISTLSPSLPQAKS